MFTLIFFSHLTLIMRFTMTNVFNIAPCLLYSLVLLIILKHCLLFFLLSDLTFSIMLCNSLTMFHVYCLPPISYKISSWFSCLNTCNHVFASLFFYFRLINISRYVCVCTLYIHIYLQTKWHISDLILQIKTWHVIINIGSSGNINIL